MRDFKISRQIKKIFVFFFVNMKLRCVTILFLMSPLAFITQF